MNSFNFFEKFRYKKCTVIGFGISNRPLVRLLCDNGAEVTVRDKNAAVSESDDARELIGRGVIFKTGEDYLSGISGDYIFRSPGVRPDTPEILAAVADGSLLTSEIEEFISSAPCKIIGITGSDGKTTTTTLTYRFLEKEKQLCGVGRAYVGGNIGKPPLSYINELSSDDVVVLELSSFQLMTLTRSPSRSVITNLSRNHMDWHRDSMDEYIGAKCNICRHAPAEMLVANAENEITYEIARNSDLHVAYFSSKRASYDSIVPEYKKGSLAVYEDGGIIYADNGEKREAMLEVSRIRIPGRHNVENFMAAIALTYGLVSVEAIKAVADGFTGVEHRLEFVRELDGVRYYNSSIDSSPTRTRAALSALDGKRPVVICGGRDKKLDLDNLAKYLCASAKAVVLNGETRDRIFEEINKCPDYDPATLRVVLADGFEDAVRRARDIAETGDIVLLSPACTSFDYFKNFEERGRCFKSIVNSF